ncbi:hypothetical protein Psta_2507 [Pirellula staleyi DSM 6068]|uniref:WXG100 family type VII secretion target n=1 Tax=Pirellula staleyi (strain ATCC 27377 / DSM 6068 / ICPB 4128) TaxID=530564 RepID=D2R5J4_PIRSD|nr:hypothetical protein [Pirellula staleyi]ADB17176.1 hypothetical protein Psta_2507 [Pirellula staleyi DSM 6068]
MKFAYFSDEMGQLSQAFGKLNECFHEVRSHWNDAAAHDFEREHLQPIAPQLKLLMNSMQRFGDVVRQMHQELDDPARHESMGD